jgi:hypothetical protein
MTDLMRALDAARHTCQGLTERHIISVPTTLAQTLLDAASCDARELRRKLRNRGSSRVLWTTAGELLSVISSLEERLAVE